jgi:uncharacterized protein involved in exopolysaccharide biosynthesis
MTTASPSLVHAARRMAASLQKETELARLGALGDLATAAEAKKAAFRQFAQTCAERGRTPPASDMERAELRLLLAAADENALILEAVSSTLQDLARRVRAAAATIADPGTYTLPGRPVRRGDRHVLAARVNAMA